VNHAQPPPTAQPTALPSPANGSPRYFALLYTPSALRPVLGTLLALADEISAGGARGLDHAVAHVRLDWWRGEAERYARGEPQHPWLRALLAQHAPSSRLDLECLVHAAALDLATQTLSAASGAALAGAKVQRAVFELAADALRTDRHAATPSPQVKRTLGDLGEQVLELERFATGAPTASATPAAIAAAIGELRRQTGHIDRALQPQLAPLLVWIALASAQARRRARRAPGQAGSMFDGFADNMLAWNTARSAMRCRMAIA
jgi:hypothetical protein